MENKNKNEVAKTSLGSLESIGQDMRAELLLKKQKQLKKFINKRRELFFVELDKYCIAKADEESDIIEYKEQKLPLLELTTKIFEPLIKVGGKSPNYSPEQISMAFDFFKQMVIVLNKNNLYIPQKEDFCSLLGISTQKLKYWKDTGSLEMRDVICQVEDYLAGVVSQAGLQRKASESMAMFTLKSSYGRRDNDPIQINNLTQNNTIVSDEELRKLLDQMK